MSGAVRRFSVFSQLTSEGRQANGCRRSGLRGLGVGEQEHLALREDGERFGEEE